MTKEQTSIKVVVRVRPYNRREREQNQRCIIKVMDNTTLLFDPDEEDDQFFFQGVKQNYRDITKRVNKKLTMEYDRVFDSDIQNQQIFEECTAPLVDSVLNGYNCSVFVYGATGAGKTFTMLGNEESPGLTFLTMRDLFEKIRAQDNIRKFDVGVSYLEVYNEQVMNLLTKSGPLKLREDSNGVVVSGLILKPIYNTEELFQMLTLGNSNRTQHPTDANAESSRSHAIFQVHIRMTELKTGTKRTVKLSMIDLAGSERAASTKGMGLRFKEGASINKSLLALGNCINKLAAGQKHIPYRDSNLTRILKDSLGGNCQTLMVANVSMSSLTYEDTFKTLTYASRAKKIRTTLRQNTLKSNMPKEFYIKKVTELMYENDKIKESNKNLEAMVETLKNSSKSYDENDLRRWYSKIDAVYSSIIMIQEYALGIKSKITILDLNLKYLNEGQEKRKLLVLNENALHEDMMKFAASVSNIEKEIGKQEQELPRWMKKYHEAKKELAKLKKEVQELKCRDILNVYLLSKDHEVKNANLNIKLNHQNEVYSVITKNADRVEKDVHMALGVLKDVYDQTNADSSFAPKLQRDLEHLERRLGPKVEHNDTDMSIQNKSTTNAVPTILVNEKRINEEATEKLGVSTRNVSTNGLSSSSSLSSFNLGSSDGNSSKRKRYLQFHINDKDLDIECVEEFVNDDPNNTSENNDSHLAAKRSKCLNETQVLSSDTFHDSNSTFCLSASNTSNSKLLSKKNDLVTNVLSDKIARLPTNTDSLKSILINSKQFTHQKLLKTVAAGLQKENKKYSPNKVVKAQKTPSAKGISSTTSQILPLKSNRQPVEGNRSQPLVRTNRAASFRTKK